MAAGSLRKATSRELEESPDSAGRPRGTFRKLMPAARRGGAIRRMQSGPSGFVVAIKGP